MEDEMEDDSYDDRGKLKGGSTLSERDILLDYVRKMASQADKDGPAREGQDAGRSDAAVWWRRERRRLPLTPRSKPAEDSGDIPSPPSSSIYGGARPVDTRKKEREIEEKLEKERETNEIGKENPKKNKPSAGILSGGAKPLETTQSEKEIEGKLSKTSATEEYQHDRNEISPVIETMNFDAREEDAKKISDAKPAIINIESDVNSGRDSPLVQSTSQEDLLLIENSIIETRDPSEFRADIIPERTKQTEVSAPEETKDDENLEEWLENKRNMRDAKSFSESLYFFIYLYIWFSFFLTFQFKRFQKYLKSTSTLHLYCLTGMRLLPS